MISVTRSFDESIRGSRKAHERSNWNATQTYLDSFTQELSNCMPIVVPALIEEMPEVMLIENRHLTLIC